MPNLLKSLLCCCNANDSTPPPNHGSLSAGNRLPQKRPPPAGRFPAASSAANSSSQPAHSQENSESSENSGKLSSSGHQFMQQPTIKSLDPDPMPPARSGSVEPESLKQGTSLTRADSLQLSQHNHTNSNSSRSVNSRRGSPSRPHSVINNADIPMDYVNVDAESKAEIALKGRRQSASLLTTPPASSVAGNLEDSGLPSSVAPNPPTSVAQHHNAANMGEAASGTPSNFDDITATGTVVDSPEAAAMYGENTILLEPQAKSLEGRKVLVLDLDETLVHSSFKHTQDADFVIPVEIENTIHDVYVVKRPGVDEFLQQMSQMYEVIVFTASVAKYGDPLLDRLDPHKFVHHRLFRESCQNFGGSYVKNLSMLGRPISSVIIVDNSPAAYAFHPFNAVPVSSWFSDIHDNELLDMVPFLDELSTEYVTDVTTVLRSEW